jgi:hypothetical protein
MTKNFTLAELTYSATAALKGIDNTPPPETLPALKFTAEGLERVREALGNVRIRITSGYRSPKLNELVGGAPTSQHVKGEACDFVAKNYGAPKDIVAFLAPKVTELGIDQLICEGEWVHISFTPAPRNVVLTYKNGKFHKGIV